MVNSTFTGGTTPLYFVGNNNQTFDLTGAESKFNADVYFNKTANNVTLLSACKFDDPNQDVYFNKGDLIASTTNLVTFGDNTLVHNASDSSFVEGPVKKIGNDAFTFPVGKNDTIYAPISISAPSNITHQFTAEYFYQDPNTVPYDITSKDISLDHISQCEYWILDRTSGTSNVNVTLSWENIRSCGVTNLSELAVARWDGSQWRDHGNGGTTGNTSAGTVTTAAAVTNFSPFTLASVTANNPLPVELISFDAVVNDGSQVDLKWVTATEINNDYFVVEKSKDGKNWEEVVWVDGAGNSNYTLEYYETDENPYEGISYYRLKQVDFDGKTSYSEIVPVAFEKNIEKNITVLPNPVKRGEAIYLEINGFKGNNILLVLRDMQGKEFYTKAHIIESNYQLKAIQLDNNIPAGTYLIVASSANDLVTQKIIIE